MATRVWLRLADSRLDCRPGTAPPAIAARSSRAPSFGLELCAQHLIPVPVAGRWFDERDQVHGRVARVVGRWLPRHHEIRHHLNREQPACRQLRPCTNRSTTISTISATSTMQSETTPNATASNGSKESTTRRTSSWPGDRWKRRSMTHAGTPFDTGNRTRTGGTAVRGACTIRRTRG